MVFENFYSVAIFIIQNINITKLSFLKLKNTGVEEYNWFEKCETMEVHKNRKPVIAHM